MLRPAGGRGEALLLLPVAVVLRAKGVGEGDLKGSVGSRERGEEGLPVFVLLFPVCCCWRVVLVVACSCRSSGRAVAAAAMDRWPERVACCTSCCRLRCMTCAEREGFVVVVLLVLEERRVHAEVGGTRVNSVHEAGSDRMTSRNEKDCCLGLERMLGMRCFRQASACVSRSLKLGSSSSSKISSRLSCGVGECVRLMGERASRRACVLRVPQVCVHLHRCI